jgi:membrane-bound lytic murein transglycosylase D
LELLLRDADLLYDRGRTLLDEGQYELGWVYFKQSLDLLENSEAAFSESPELADKYAELLSEINKLRVYFAVGPDEPPLPVVGDLGESLSPLDEIGAVNLYTIKVDPGLEDLVNEDLRQSQYDFPVVVNQQVLKFLNYFQGRGRKSMEQALRRSGRYVDMFRRVFAEEGVPRDLVYMAHVESLFKPKAYSRARARGIWQFVKGTARLYDLEVGWWLDERLDVQKATPAAARHLNDLNEEFGDWYLALAAYNGGPGRVTRVFRRHGKMDYWTMAKRRLLPRETRNYVPSILAAIIIYRNPERYGFQVEKDEPLKYETAKLDFQVDLGVVADAAGVPLTTLLEMNPELQRGVSPPNPEGHWLKVPVGMGPAVEQQVAEIPPDKRLRLKHHKVRQGETLSHIAGKYGISIRAIAEVNHIRNIHRLKLGQDLIIPLSGYSPAASSSGGGGGTGNYMVRRGDSLYKIARRHGVSVDDLVRWNKLNPGAHIHPGQELRLTGK